MTDPAALLEHAGFLRALARGLLCDDARVDDVLQQTWLVALENAPREERSLRSWLAKVVVNVARKARREERAARREVVADATDSLGREAIIRGVVDALFALKEPYRTVIILRYYDNLAIAEIAERIDVPIETVRTRLKRAIAKLRTDLDHAHGGDRRAWALALAPLLGSMKSARTAGDSTALPSPGASEPLSHGAIAPKVFLVTAAAVVGVGLWFGVARLLPGGKAPSARETPLASASERRPAAPAPLALTNPGSAIESRVAADSRDPATPPNPALTASGGSLLVHLRWQEDGTPAAGVRARVLKSEHAGTTEEAEGHRLERVSDPDGTFRVDGLGNGDFTILLDRAAPRRGIEIDSAKPTEVTVDVPPGVTLEGTVVDDAGAPLRGSSSPRSESRDAAPHPRRCSPRPTECSRGTPFSSRETRSGAASSMTAGILSPRGRSSRSRRRPIARSGPTTCTDFGDRGCSRTLRGASRSRSVRTARIGSRSTNPSNRPPIRASCCRT